MKSKPPPEASESGVHLDTPIWNLRLPHAPNDVVFFTTSGLGLVWVLCRIVDRFSGSGALLITALLPVLALFGYLIRAFSTRPQSDESSVGQRRARPPRPRRKIPSAP